MRGVVTVREHGKLAVRPELTEEDAADLDEAVARGALRHRAGDLAASKYVGVVTTRRGVVVEVLPKIDLGGESDPGHERIRQVFLRMLRCSRRLPVELPESGCASARNLATEFQEFGPEQNRRTRIQAVAARHETAGNLSRCDRQFRKRGLTSAPHRRVSG